MDVQALENFRANLRTAMALRGISQRTLAEKIGAGYPQINRILQGKSVPTLDSAEKLSRGVGFSLVAMLASPAEFESYLPQKISA